MVARALKQHPVHVFQMASFKARHVSIEDALSLYPYSFLSDDTRAWVARCAADPAIMSDIRDNTVVAYRGSELADVVRAVTTRSPVYFGEHKLGMFSADRLAAVHGYTLEDVDTSRACKFALAAPNYSRRGRFTTVHLMGVNLESCRTAEYRAVVRDGRLCRRGYETAVADMFAMLVACVDATGVEAPTVRMPAVGLGAYLSALDADARSVCVDVFFEQLAAAASSRPRWRFQLCAFGGLGARTCDGVAVLRDVNLFSVDVAEDVVLVNAWDTVSFIGNGGALDRTVDGMMVAGIMGGAELVNCSYLHNPFFGQTVRLLSADHVQT